MERGFLWIEPQLIGLLINSMRMAANSWPIDLTESIATTTKLLLP
jgi:hypothetical protein